MTVEPLLNARRHDLDAARSLAMLLGIGLHAAMAFVGGLWMVTDGPAEPLLGLFVVGIHGFRMPLFFLLSGFFSAMLWDRRGMGGLISHRLRRILLPLAIGCVTVLPLTWLATNWATSASMKAAERSAAAVSERAPDIWRASAIGDLEAVRAFGADAERVNAPDPRLGVTPLGWAAMWGQVESTRVLLELKADPSGRYRDGNTPLHTACFFGRSEVAQLLMNAGADPAARSNAGELPTESLRHDQRTTEFIAGFLKVSVRFEDVQAGRERIRGLLANGAVQETTAGEARGTVGEAGQTQLARAVARLQQGTFFQHLWFLWFLCLLNAGLVAVVALGRLVPCPKLPRVLCSMPMCLVWLVPLTMVPQFFMQSGGTTAGFGPDTSAGVVPMPHVLLFYAVFFGFGALVYRVRGGQTRMGGLWWVWLPIAMAILPIGLIFAFQPGRALAIIPDDSARRLVGMLLQVLYAWLATFGVLGLCEAVFAKPRGWVRYLSDSAYWQYLAHLPLVIVGQVLMLGLDIPALAKWAILVLGCLLILLTSYRLFVRHTIVGRLLNG